ncbi:MAG: hypothetical protein UY31_C0054G0003 [Candidatus Wolfebacteria bacterium GW2011_GWE1_48_7]|uniref:FG-GAP repeat protein n=2 Tax=Candidatus Wolfeibacteriota TaxID=1752735 RepID=A0A0G1X3A0_9BACT|nr:MAG: hypothetical protein UY19_C0023G0005 [Candidatus Wolfebacteria bacterium GW2011_GWA2_47_9b]KKU98448.1 MAG: hypothetical protein UY31_C0054G0003 [Candidatus Wolfebacteria bacterium GW2011_GWE1_48_7]
MSTEQKNNWKVLRVTNIMEFIKKYRTGIAVAVIIIAFVLIQQYGIPKKEQYVFGGTLVPGQLIAYKLEDGTFIKQVIDEVGEESIFDIKVGDVKNNGVAMVVATINKRTYDSDHCAIKIYEKTNDGFRSSVVDSMGEPFCRDIEIGDAYNNGTNSIVIATHGEGMVIVYTWNEGDQQWKKDVVMQNITREMDGDDGRTVITPSGKTYQTAIHTVEIADVDGDGKNELIAAHGTGNMYKGEPESWVGVYHYEGGKWVREIAGHLEGRQHRRLSIAHNLYGDGRNVIVAGTWPNSILVAYAKKDGVWEKRVIDDNVKQDNNKAITAKDFDNDGREELFVSTDPDGYVFMYDFTGSDFVKTEIDNLSKLPEFVGKNSGGYDAFAYDIDKDANYEVYVNSLSIIRPKDSKPVGLNNISEGHLMQYYKEGDTWKKNTIDKGTFWAMTAGEL